MILVERTEKRGDLKGRHIVAIFGVGLIGRSILTELCKMGADKISETPFTWNSVDRQPLELEAIQQDIFASFNKDAPLSISRMDVVWAAGQSGFGSSDDQVIPEVNAFEKVLSFSARLQHRAANARHSFHLISSAGGLFEGQKHVDHMSVPRPLRPYGCSKLKQEQLMSGLPAQTRKIIYRLSTVYGFSSKGVRFGLVNSLIRNSILRQSSNIFGNAVTIRDYVLVSDVGKFIAKRLLDVDQISYSLILASGKPTTIFEILNRIERIVGRRSFYSFDNVTINATDISFSPAILPKFWFPTDLDTGLRQTARYLTASSLSLDSTKQFLLTASPLYRGR